MARTTESYSTNKEERFSLKDHLFNKEKVTQLAEEIKQAYHSFDEKAFVKQVVAKFPQLELKARIGHITDVLEEHLPNDFEKALGIILNALPAPLDASKTDDDFGDFIYEPYNTFISRVANQEQYTRQAFDALEQTTQRFSAEFALRPFIKNFEDETLKRVTKWSTHPNYHVRRLASEGIRPNLPWGGKITTDPTKIIAILDNLYHDKTRYVTRSVANNLNDISKIDYRLVLQTLKRWQQEGKQDADEFNFIVRQALRTQIKNGEKEVMKFLGYKTNIKYSVKNLQYKKVIKIDEAQEFSFDLVAGETGGYMVDYVVHYVTKNGETTDKVMKLKDLKLKKGEKVTIRKKYPFRPMSTRTLYPGVHSIEVQINGIRVEKFEFDLVG